LAEVYPPQLPDLFQGSQLVVLGRYSGHGSTTLRLKGRVGTQSREFVYETNLAGKGGEARDFVEHLWARRKVGYLLDQLRLNGEKKELIDEVTALAKKYGIATPYTSYLIVPDAAMPIAARSALMSGAGGQFTGSFGAISGGISGGINGGIGGAPALTPLAGGRGVTSQPRSVADFARDNKPEDRSKLRDGLEQERLHQLAEDKQTDEAGRKAGAEATSKREVLALAKDALSRRRQDAIQTGKLGVDLAVESNNLRNQSRLTPTAVRSVAGRNLLEIGGVWIDDEFDATMATVSVKAQSPAYFRLLDRHHQVKDVFRLGNHLLWVAPARTALVVDTSVGKEELTDAEIDALFAAKK
jgi:Ca-activated chloride channel family protein